MAKKIIGEIFKHKRARITGAVDRMAVHPDGKRLARIKDHWFFVDELERVA